MTREIDEQCARVMGVSPDYAYPQRPNDPAMVYFPYSADPAASRLLEDEIERRGLSRQYVNWLCAYTSLCSDVSDQCWAILRATPEQKCMAFLEAVKHV